MDLESGLYPVPATDTYSQCFAMMIRYNESALISNHWLQPKTSLLRLQIACFYRSKGAFNQVPHLSLPSLANVQCWVNSIVHIFNSHNDCCLDGLLKRSNCVKTSGVRVSLSLLSITEVGISNNVLTLLSPCLRWHKIVVHFQNFACATLAEQENQYTKWIMILLRGQEQKLYMETENTVVASSFVRYQKLSTAS